MTIPWIPCRPLGWTVGKRVLRPNRTDSGTIVEVAGQIKVKWDRGRTSYFDAGCEGNVELDPTEPPRIESADEIVASEAR